MGDFTWRDDLWLRLNNQPGPGGPSQNLSRNGSLHRSLTSEEAGASVDSGSSLQPNSYLEFEYDDSENEEISDAEYEGDDEYDEDEDMDGHENNAEEEYYDEEEYDDEEDHHLNALDDHEVNRSERSLSPWRSAEFIPLEGVESIAEQLIGMERRRRRDDESDEDYDSETEEPPRRRNRTEFNDDFYGTFQRSDGIIDLPDAIREALNGIPVVLELARILLPFSKEL